MEEVREKTILMVTFGVLALAFFSYSVNPGTGAAILTSTDNFDCSDLTYGAQFVEEEITTIGSTDTTRDPPYKSHYDIDRNGKITKNDLDLIRELMITHNCRVTENECTKIGRTRCDNLGKIGTCVKDKNGIMVWSFKSCPDGGICKYKTTTNYFGLLKSYAK